MNIQSFIDSMFEIDKQTRSKYHLTLGGLIKFLSENSMAEIYLGYPHSYRGYYSDLSLAPLDKPIRAFELLKELNENVLDKELTGYKGGEFLMSADTPLWVASYGDCGEALVSVKIDEYGNSIEIETKDLDE